MPAKTLSDVLKSGVRGTTVTLVIRLTAQRRGYVHGAVESVGYSKGARRYVHKFPPRERPKAKWKLAE